MGTKFSVLRFSRETEIIENYLSTCNEIHCKALAYGIMEAEKSRDQPSASRGPGKAAGVEFQ